MGANSFRKRVFQGPLTLGLHSTTFRSALPSATLPYPRRFFLRANRALVISLSSFPSVMTDVRFPRVLSQVSTCSGTRANSFSAQTAHLLISLSSVPVGYNRRLLLAGALTGFHLFGYPRKFHHRAKPRTSFFRFLLFLSVRTDVCF